MNMITVTTSVPKLLVACRHFKKWHTVCNPLEAKTKIKWVSAVESEDGLDKYLINSTNDSYYFLIRNITHGENVGKVLVQYWKKRDDYYVLVRGTVVEADNMFVTKQAYLDVMNVINEIND